MKTWCSQYKNNRYQSNNLFDYKFSFTAMYIQLYSYSMNSHMAQIRIIYTHHTHVNNNTRSLTPVLSTGESLQQQLFLTFQVHRASSSSFFHVLWKSFKQASSMSNLFNFLVNFLGMVCQVLNIFSSCYFNNDGPMAFHINYASLGQDFVCSMQGVAVEVYASNLMQNFHAFFS